MQQVINFIRRVYRFVERLFTPAFWSLNHLVGTKIKDHCIMLLPASLGDTLLVLANLELIERETGVPIFPMLKSNHTVVAELCHCQTYSVFSDKSNLYCLPCVKKAYRCISGKQVKERMVSKIKPGTLFFAHPDNYPEFDRVAWKFSPMPEVYRNFLGLRTAPVFPKTVCKIECAREIPDPEHTIMLCPEASTPSTMLPPDFWTSLYSSLKELGWNVCYNTIAPVSFLPREHWLNCTSRDAVAIGQRAAFVISLRSGLADLLANRGEKLIVIYPDKVLKSGKTFFETFDLNAYFSRSDVYSCIYRQKSAVITSIVNYIQSKVSSAVSA